MIYRDEAINPAPAAVHFYTRRFLRLAPPYYFAIALALMLGLGGMASHWLIPALYLTNFDIGLHGQWMGHADHFWSLAVEEQFYIVWFLVVVVLPSRWFLAAVASAIFACFVFRLGVYVSGLSNPLTTVLLPGHLATLATGGLIAYAQRYAPNGKIEKLFLSGPVLAVSLVAFALTSLSLPYVLLPRLLLYPFIAALCFGALVRQCAAEVPNLWLDVLKLAPLRHIGKISYGIFVYHMFIPPHLVEGFVGSNPWAVFIGLVAVSLILAQISWTLLERPILRFKPSFRRDVAKRGAAGRQKKWASAGAASMRPLPE